MSSAILRSVRYLTASTIMLFSVVANADFLPPNDLHLQDSFLNESNISEQQFNEIVDRIVALYQPLAEIHGATVSADKRWQDSTVNASANQMGKTWYINMFGGLARRPEVTPDGFALVVCHELGHHFAGFPFKGASWAANEGQSDYFATQSCARMIWKSETERNAEFAKTVHPTAKLKCDTIWGGSEDRHLCYRSAAAGLSLGSLLAALKNSPEPDFDTPSDKEVSRTDGSHPAAQCRLDTYLAGAVCAKLFDPEVIPAKELNPLLRGTKKAEELAFQKSCSAAVENELEGARPRCWFKPKTTSFQGN